MIYIILLIALLIWGVSATTVLLAIMAVLWHHGTPPKPPAKAVSPPAGAGATDSHPPAKPQSPHTVLDYSGWTRDSIDTIQDAPSTPHEYQPPLPYQQSGLAEN